MGQAESVGPGTLDCMSRSAAAVRQIDVLTNKLPLHADCPRKFTNSDLVFGCVAGPPPQACTNWPLPPETVQYACCVPAVLLCIYKNIQQDYVAKILLREGFS